MEHQSMQYAWYQVTIESLFTIIAYECALHYSFPSIIQQSAESSPSDERDARSDPQTMAQVYLSTYIQHEFSSLILATSDIKQVCLTAVTSAIQTVADILQYYAASDYSTPMIVFPWINLFDSSHNNNNNSSSSSSSNNNNSSGGNVSGQSMCLSQSSIQMLLDCPQIRLSTDVSPVEVGVR